jgi:DNA replicative helicase MCM subunit Mcm2 (Cdc46/Mcm family)
LEVIRELAGGKRDFDINETDILNEMSRREFDEYEVEEALKQLSQRSQIYTPGAGRWRLVN